MYLKKAVEDYEPTEKLTSLDLVQATVSYPSA